MKLLFLSPYIYTPTYKEHSKNKTGFGFMVYDIAAGAGKRGNQVVLATHAFGPERHCEGFKVSANSLLKSILYGRYKGLVRFGIGLKKADTSLKDVVKGAYYYLHIGYIRHLVKKEKPDVVHIHGCSVETEETVKMLRDLGVPHVITLHGLLQDDLGASQYLKNCERKLIKDKDIHFTVISSKMRERFLSDYYGAETVENVDVITNGIEVDCQNASYDIRKKHGIAADKNIILSVGSVCKLKNQSQTVRAFSLLPKELREQTVLLFAGTVYENTPTLKEIEELGLDNQVLCLGFVSRDELCNYYRAAALTVTASIAEGFGIPMVEGFVYGVPCVTFSDLDAIGDIYNECAMLLCRERTDEALAETICNALSNKWNEEQIKAHSKKFSLDAMSQKYQAVYEGLLRQ